MATSESWPLILRNQHRCESPQALSTTHEHICGSMGAVEGLGVHE